MNTEEISFILKHLLSNSRTHFLGVFASDKLPPINTIAAYTPCCYVANTDPTGWGGSHWVAFFHPLPNKLEFFDSYGRPPQEFGYTFPKSIQISHNKFQIQGLGSQVCGHFSIFFLYHRSQNYTMYSIIKKFQSLPFSRSASLVYSFVQKVNTRLNK